MLKIAAILIPRIVIAVMRVSETGKGLSPRIRLSSVNCLTLVGMLMLVFGTKVTGLDLLGFRGAANARSA
jgi:hypothetical protein